WDVDATGVRFGQAALLDAREYVPDANGAGSRRSYAPPRHGHGDAVLHAARFHRRYGLRGRRAAPPPRSRGGGSAAAPGPAPSTGAAAATHAAAVEPGLRDARGLRAGGLRLVQP
ncbi:unnamed protein product, partial [Ectocarpus sp. 12 AP-2014]